MKLKELLKSVVEVGCNIYDENMEINNICFDDSQVLNQSAYVCLNGTKQDGHIFAESAVKKGARLVVCEHFIEGLNVPQIVVDDTRKTLSVMCKNLSGCACDKMKIIGITGTNGKTTSAFLMAYALNKAGKSVGLIGTQGVYINNELIAQNLTTPDPTFLHKYFETMQNNGVEYVVMEVSAHAIDLKKIYGITFEIGLITNITQDHLDYFQTFENYRKTKLSFLFDKNVKCVVYNSDDVNIESYCQKIITPSLSYGINNPSDVFAVEIEMNAGGNKFVLNMSDTIEFINSRLIGKYNIYNLLGVVASLAVLGFCVKDIKNMVESFDGVEGRFNVFTSRKGFSVVVDYAHTPDGLENVLSTAGELTAGNVICVFGCGGDRDREKRPIMARISEEKSDYVIVTSDNPRFENPQLIIDDIEKGFKAHNHISFVERREAIMFAFKIAKRGDVIVICGKGAEKYMDIMGKKNKYCDLDEVKKLLSIER